MGAHLSLDILEHKHGGPFINYMTIVKYYYWNHDGLTNQSWLWSANQKPASKPVPQVIG